MIFPFEPPLSIRTRKWEEMVNTNSSGFSKCSLKVLGRCATIGLLVGALAGQSFAQNGPTQSLHMNLQPDISAAPSISRAVTNSNSTAPAPSPAATDQPAAEQGFASLTPLASAKPSIVREAYREIDQQATQTDSIKMSPEPSEHHVRKAPLALAIVGVAVAGFGTFLMAESRNKGVAAAFLAPGAAAAGLGFYFAFR